MAVPEKAPKPWVVEYFHHASNELGYGGIKVAIQCDKAPDLQLLRQHVSTRRSSATVPIEVETRESGEQLSAEDHLDSIMHASPGVRSLNIELRSWKCSRMTLKRYPFTFHQPVAFHQPQLNLVRWALGTDTCALSIA